MTELLPIAATGLAAATARAITARSELIERLRADDTDCLRLLHGATEGVPGLSVDRYGPLCLVQTFREPLAPEQLEALEAAVRDSLGADAPEHLVYNHRGAGLLDAIDWHDPPPQALAPHIARELGLRYRIQARHRGRDPWLFLDLRVARRFVRQHSAGRSVLNLFAYTCGVGLCAAAGGASEVVNVDFAVSALRVGRDNASLNGFEGRGDKKRCRFVHADFFPYARQLAGLPVKGRAHRHRDFRRVERRHFDLVVLDPPKWATSAFGAVDLVRDYPALLKPSLLATRPGGQLVCTNNVSAVDFDEWLHIVLRAAEKAGRPVRSHSRLLPEADFPSPDASPPLKILLLDV